MDAIVKREVVETSDFPVQASKPIASIDPNATESDSDSHNYSDFDSSDNRSRVLDGINGFSFKKRKLSDLGVVLPIGFLDPLPPEEPMPLSVSFPQSQSAVVVKSCKQFWKAGDYEGGIFNGSESLSFGGMDHVRVHPKFLHSNATSHKWALGAFAELLDNSLDEICHGATYVNTDMLENKKDGSRMLLVEDNGGGMDPLSMRQCMSLGYSEKSKSANTIGQYGNGFKTSTMRLGADVIVFSRCCGKDGKSPMQSIGMLSYTFLRGTGKEDIVVPMLDYEKVGQVWHKMLRSSPGDWSRNVETIVQWSPYSSEADLLHQFNLMEDQGTRIVIYNLWEDEHGELELDFDTDRYDIQIKGVNREDAKIQMAQQFPNSRHFLTYRHSLRSYASILYLRLPPGFRIILRGKDVEHHNIVNDMMLTQEITYRPVGPDGVPKDLNMFAIVKIGFVKDAKEHIDVQGFNVYHKNRLIKPFWRVWNSSGSDGRGVIGVLEANFIEPAHDKQGFERTIVLSRLEARLQYMQKQYWSSKCQEIGYAPRRHKKLLKEPALLESSPECLPQSSSRHSKKSTSPIKVTSLLDTDKCQSHSNQKQVGKKPEKSSKVDQYGNGHMYGKEENRIKTTSQFGQRENSQESTSQCAEDNADYKVQPVPPGRLVNDSPKAFSAQNFIQKDGFHRNASFSPYPGISDIVQDYASNGRTDGTATCSQSKMADVTSNGNGHATFDSNAYGISLLKKENNDLKEMCKSLEVKLQEAEQKLKEMDKEQETLIDILSEERSRRDNEEENLRKKLKGASDTIEVLVNKVRRLENTRSHSCKPER